MPEYSGLLRALFDRNSGKKKEQPLKPMAALFFVPQFVEQSV